MSSTERAERVFFKKSWLIRIGAALVVLTVSLLVLLSIAEFALRVPGPLTAIALYSYFVGSAGMILLCLGAIQVLMRRRRSD